MDMPLQRIDIKSPKIVYLASVKLGPDQDQVTTSEEEESS